MNHNNTYNMREAINMLLKTYRIDKKIDQSQVIAAYTNVVGPLIQKHTTSVYMKNNTLHISVDNAALKNELGYARERLIQALNKAVGKEVVQNLIIH